MRRWISIAEHGGRPGGAGPSFIGVLVFLALIPILVLVGLMALFVGMLAALAGLSIGALNRLRGVVARSSGDQRRNVRVIPREE
ncbi:MAG: hypothetical protein KF787_10945 [Phycisphaeraceae bacterium]|nr:hypothetical protein [Phycisphaerae bacterium]MBX3393152.1 hypothetical protein [Phycisphaeraceae bacterium]HRJ50321.1 hypothetical protein [Phycisphaerales bacterium]